jgi:PAS domain S-box-containing protein
MPTTDPDGPAGGVHTGEAEESLREERALYKDLVEAQPRGIYRLRVLASPPAEPESWRASVDETYRVEFVSARFCEVLAVDASTFRSNPGCVADLVVSEDRRSFATANAEALSHRRPFRWEGRLTVGSEVRWIRWESLPRVLESGDTVWTGTVEDVTERRTAEARLRESEALFRSYFEMPLIGACITSPTKGWLEVNDRLCAILGYSREELVTRTWPELTHHDDLQEDVRRFESVVRGEIDGYSLEKRFVRKDGTIVPVDLAVSCIRTPDGSVDYFVALLQDITERKKAERELQAHRDHLEELVAERTAELARHQQLLDETSRLARVGGWEYDVQKDELSWTAVVQELHEVEPGYKLTVAAGLGFYAPEARPVVSEALGSALRTGQPFDLEVPLVTAKGRRLWVRAIGRAHVEDGKVVRVGGVLQDIDARKRAEEELKQHRIDLEELVAERTRELEKSRSRLVEAQAVSHLGSWEWDAERDALTGSEEFYRLFGVPPAQLTNLAELLTFIHPDDRERMRRATDEALSWTGESPFQASCRILAPDGRCRHVSARAVGAVAGDGRRTGLMGTCLDVTELAVTEEALRESEERLRRIVSESPFPIGLYAEDGEILLVNRAWCRITGYSPEEVPTVAEWAERAYGPRKDVAQAEIASRFDLSESIREGEYAIRTKDGGQRFWDFSSAPVGLLPDGRRLVTTMAMDVTERRLAEDELLAYRQHLEELVRARTVELENAVSELESFSYSVSHDLRAPLRAMDGHSAVLLDEHAGLLDEEGRHHLDRIRKAAGRMGHLIDGLLGLARISRRELVGTPVDLTALALSVAGDLRALEPDREAQVTVADGMTAEGDPRLLHVVLENLIGNALKFTSTRPTAVVEVGCEERGGETVFFVRDNGVGFEMAYAQKLFTPFQRLHGIDEFPGTGIGLATVQRIVVRHGGRIWAESAPGAGATFYFTLRPASG